MKHIPDDQTVWETFNEISGKIVNKVFTPRVTAIIPAYNEEATIVGVIETVKKSMVDQIVVVDDGSQDNTYAVAKEAGALVVRHRKNKGKGAAMKTGLKRSNGSVIVFLDGDLRCLSSRKVNSLIKPILNNEADFVKSYFTSYKSKTNTSIFLYRPLLKYLFSEKSIVHPVSGQIAGMKTFFSSIDFPNGYDVDISILIDAIKKNLRIKEVCLGKLLHRVRTPMDIENMANLIIFTILSKAGIEIRDDKMFE